MNVYRDIATVITGSRRVSSRDKWHAEGSNEQPTSRNSYIRLRTNRYVVSCYHKISNSLKCTVQHIETYCSLGDRSFGGMLECIADQATFKIKRQPVTRSRCPHRFVSLVVGYVHWAHTPVMTRKFGRDNHKEAAPFRRKSFPFFNEFSLMYARDHATGKNAQTETDILEEMQECNDTINEETEGENPAGYSFDNEDFSNIQPQTSGETIKEAGIEFSKSVGVEVNIQQKAQELDGILSQLEGLIARKRVLASIKLPESPTLMFVFFSIDPDRRLEWLRTFLADH
ncbi:Uncharacterized protein TCM_022786 [Theobroma cacao]|uniref:Uncharacterized protein n=1 Tax=Theobroma cacao TaxID=3641 RepID=A0A061EUA3_THECC|nr:Uncharacterized protein TCM_022786 [Theobroma cacao]